MNVIINGVSARNGGGITTIHSLVSALAKLDFDIHYIVSVATDVLPEVKSIASYPNVSLIPIAEASRSLIGRLWWEQNTLLGFAQTDKKAILLSLGSLASFRWRGPQVLLVQSIAPFQRQAQRGKGLRNYFRYGALRSLAHRSFHVARIVVVNCEATKSIVMQNGCPSAKICIIPLGRSELFARYAIGKVVLQKPRGDYVLTVSALNTHKNLEVLIRAMAELRRQGRRWPLRIVGGAMNGRYLASLRGLVSAVNVTDQVEFMGPIPYEQLPAIYANAGCFALTSLVENFPHTLVEAMSMGCPIVSSQQIPTLEVCGNSALECNARDPFDVAAKIERVMTDTELRSRMRSFGQARAEELDWSRLAEQYLGVFKQLAGE